MKKQIKDFKKENAGRSMTEMLGVLAIIGVLSLGGIIGYKLAMNRYAANQIAYEINMMKTDAKVKIMQGNDTLTLGEPYDSHKIRFGDYGTTFGCSFIKDADDESVVEEAATCQVANAYYIELQHIPEGICKPLANLIENMNDLIAFDINPKENGEVEEGGDCEEDENILNAVFSAEPGDLEVLKCEKNEDCPTGLQCYNHLCVECTEDTDCKDGDGGICTKNNTCDYCNKGEVRDENGNCVECMEDTDCRDNAPHCDPETHTCGNCPIGTPYWSDTLSKCVECTEDAHCDKETNPVCNKDTGECEPCPEDQPWNGEFCGCRTNDDCKTNEFCLTSGCTASACKNTGSIDQNPYYVGTIIEEESCTGAIHQCVKISEYTATNHDTNSPYVMSNHGMNWWSAQRFCEALPGNKQMVKVIDLRCCTDFGSRSAGFCYAKNDIICSKTNGFSNIIKAIRKAETGNEDKGINCYWLADPWGIDPGPDSCAVYMLTLDQGGVSNNNRSNDHIDGGQRYALCQ